MLRKLIFTFAVLLFVAASTSVFAITYGQPDGNLHPNVGALVVPYNGQNYLICSGTLISPTVFLTAAHCNVGITRVYVSFDSEFTSASTLPPGTFYGDAQFSQRQNDSHDIAVVVLDAPVGITPALLPTAGSLENLPHDQAFTAVGYGTQEPEQQPGGIVNAFLGTREYAVSTLNATNRAWLRLSQNQATGDGGTCNGDSGGPNFLGAGDSETDIIASLTVTGDIFCYATNVTYRLDTDSARNFLSNFVALP